MILRSLKSVVQRQALRPVILRSLKSVVQRPVLRRALYRSGALHAYHQARNRDWLSAVMFHRVLSPADPRWHSADPEYAIRDDLFGDCLQFFKKHYSIVSMEEVIRARRGQGHLPPCPLLITLDDGWRDNVEYALPHLRRLEIPAVLFLVADVVDQSVPLYQERLVNAWRAGRLDAERTKQLWIDAGGAPADAPPLSGATRDELEPLRAVIDRLEHLAPDERTRLLDGLGAGIDDGNRHMVTSSDVRELAAHRVTIGAHGRSHIHITRAPDQDAELAGARERIGEILGIPPSTMSFPHGAHTPAIVDRARAAGYELIFTSIPELSPAHGQRTDTIGRFGFTGPMVTDKRGRFAPEELALFMFRIPHGRL